MHIYYEGIKGYIVSYVNNILWYFTKTIIIFSTRREERYITHISYKYMHIKLITIINL